MTSYSNTYAIRQVLSLNVCSWHVAVAHGAQMNDTITTHDQRMLAHLARPARPAVHRLTPQTGGPRVPVDALPLAWFDVEPERNLRISDLCLALYYTEEARVRKLDARTARAFARCFAESALSEALATLETWTGSGRCDRCADLN